ncbi:MAG: Lrp/AsnC family transcriptional regulator [Candidatus Odinarchaeota archaeon]
MKPLSRTDLKIIRILQYNPRISYAELASELNVSPPTAKAKVTSLTERKVLKHSYAVYSPEALGLKRFKVYFRLSHSSQLAFLEKALDNHPYLHYRARFYGDGVGLYSDFDIPEHGRNLLETYLDEIKELSLFENWQMTKSSGIRVSTFPDFNVWNPDDVSWQYDWETWKKQLENPDLSLDIPQPEFYKGPFDLLTLQLLNEVTINSDIKQIKFVEKYKSSRSTISKKMDFINNNLISAFWSRFDRRYFDLNSYKILLTKCDDIEKVNSFSRSLLSDNKPPFRISLDVVEDGFLVMINMPVFHESQLIYGILDHFPETRILTLDINPPSGKTIYFYVDNYDTESGSWKLSRDYVVDQPLESLKKEIKET